MVMQSSPAPSSVCNGSNKRLSPLALGAGGVGNLLEWYDFGLYGYFAPVLARLFFPSGDPLASLIGAYGGFAVGFAMRPIGAVVLGTIGDRIGRRFVLMLSVSLMGAGTTAIALLPSYSSVGVAGPLLLLLVRMFQGFSVGGEYTGSVAYLVETAPPHRRGFAGSMANIGSTAGVLLAAGVAAVTVTFAGEQALISWAWRLPFLFGGVLAMGALAARRRLREEAAALSRVRELPLWRAFRHDGRMIGIAILFTAGYGVVNYLTMVFFPTYASEFGGLKESQALQITTLAQAFALLVVPLAGLANDTLIRRRTLLIVAFLAECVAAVGAFWLARDGGFGGFAMAQLAFGGLLALVMGTDPAMLSEQFPAEYRVSAYSLAFNIGLGIAGGTAPAIATALIAATGMTLAPAFYLMLAAAVAAVAAFLMPDRSREPLA
ncbi:MAG: MFS transporter [Acidobacteriia bacterium]|nr:MFS transporter [Methyloceanibacter sp.]MBX5472187.1 MFS transporter [Acetobacteraceae bacterium]MCL6491196.1 MFS transporter [Terriglobia bacterium]